MRKKVTSILLTILYLVSNVGYSLDMHYMDGVLMDVSFDDSASCPLDLDCCAKEKGECTLDAHAKNKEKHFNHTLQEHANWTKYSDLNGCSNHQIEMKVVEPQLENKKIIFKKNQQHVAIIITYVINDVCKMSKNDFVVQSTTKEYPPTLPIYILHQHFIFYA